MSDALSSKNLVVFGLRDILFGEYNYNAETGLITSKPDDPRPRYSGRV